MQGIARACAIAAALAAGIATAQDYGLDPAFNGGQ